MKNLNLQFAHQQDLPKILAIYNQHIINKQATADLSPISLTEQQTWFDQHTQNRPIVVAKIADKVVGWGSLNDLYPRPAYHISAEVSLYIDEKHIGQGIGSDLLQYLLTIAPSCDIQQVLAKVFAHNPASLRLFQKFGFQQWGYLPQVCDMQGFIADVVILGRRV